MIITHNCLFLPNKKISCVEMQVKYSGKSIQDAQETVKATGIYSIHQCQKSNIEHFISLASSSIPSEFALNLESISLLICITQSQINRIPNLASHTQNVLGINTNVLCLDIIDGCNGFVKALKVADSILDVGEKALIVSGEINSSITHESEISTRILFGDGICFTIVVREEAPIKSKILNDGARGEFIQANFERPCMLMNGFEVFRFTNSEVPKLVKSCEWISDDYSPHLFVLHQASKLVTDQIARKLGIEAQDPPIFASGAIGNIASGSIPGWIALTANERIQAKTLHCVGYGAGLSWGLATITAVLESNEVVYVDA